MSEVIILGGSDFVLGFKLVGIKNIIELEEEEDPSKKVDEILDQGKSGILVTDQRTFEKLDHDMQHDLEDSVRPVAIILSEESNQENLRRMITKAIGVDVLNK